MEPKEEHVLDLESPDLRREHQNFLDEIGIYFFILRIEREVKPTPVEKFLRITPGVIRKIEDGKMNWNMKMLDEIWDYYCSLPVKRSILSKLKARDNSGPLAQVIKMGLKKQISKNSCE
jgi:hypothetical protein